MRAHLGTRACLWKRFSPRVVPASLRQLSVDTKASSLASTDFPVLDYVDLERRHDEVRQNAIARGSTFDISQLLDLKAQLSQHIHGRNILESERNSVQKEIVSLQPSDPVKSQLASRSRELRTLIQDAKLAELELKQSVHSLSLQLPNWTSPQTPIGPPEKASVVGTFGSLPAFPFPSQDHMQLGSQLGWLNMESSSLVSGPRTVSFAGMGAALEIALSSWAISKLVSRGFTLYHPSDLVRKEFVSRCGFLPGGSEASSEHVYSIEGTGLCLSGTSEIGLVSMFYDTIFQDSEVPIKMAGISHCFRPEVGNAGKDVRGIYRLHQFTKVEMASICMPHQSAQIHEEMLNLEIEMYQELGLHFRVLEMPSQELGATAYRKWDCEAWMPSRNSFGEISSTSNCTDYQSRRLNLRHKPSSGERVFLHTVNGTAVAVPRLMIAIMEQFQKEDGSVDIPHALHPYIRQLGLDPVSGEAVRP